MTKSCTQLFATPCNLYFAQDKRLFSTHLFSFNVQIGLNIHFDLYHKHILQARLSFVLITREICREELTSFNANTECLRKNFLTFIPPNPLFSSFFLSLFSLYFSFGSSLSVSQSSSLLIFIYLSCIHIFFKIISSCALFLWFSLSQFLLNASNIVFLSHFSFFSAIILFSLPLLLSSKGIKLFYKTLLLPFTSALCFLNKFTNIVICYVLGLQVLNL